MVASPPYPQQELCPCTLRGGLKAAPSTPGLFQIFLSAVKIITDTNKSIQYIWSAERSQILVSTSDVKEALRMPIYVALI